MVFSVAMYASWNDAWRNWSRSLPLRDRYAGRAGWLGLTAVALAQALPLPLLLMLWRSVPRPQVALAINGLLLLVRLGVLGGTARAYVAALDVLAFAAGRSAGGRAALAQRAAAASRLAWPDTGSWRLEGFRMKLASLLVGHLAALLFGLAGLLVALPNPQWWSGDANAVRVFEFGMQYAGATHIVLGAAAVFVFGWVPRPRRTVIFFLVSTLLSLSSELIGTGTGWPFGNYEYTAFLGYKILDRVPFSIPLSWFSMGLVSYLLGSLLAARLGGRRTFWSLALGVWLLTAWDLVLDPAMADPSLRVQFWTWHETGPYFGMPIQNLVGWSVTGLLYMGMSRLLWGSDIDVGRIAGTAWFPFTVYVANVGFAMALSLSAGLWPPVVLAALVGMLPAPWRYGRTGHTCRHSGNARGTPRRAASDPARGQRHPHGMPTRRAPDRPARRGS